MSIIEPLQTTCDHACRDESAYSSLPKLLLETNERSFLLQRLVINLGGQKISIHLWYKKSGSYSLEPDGVLLLVEEADSFIKSPRKVETLRFVALHYMAKGLLLILIRSSAEHNTETNLSIQWLMCVKWQVELELSQLINYWFLTTFNCFNTTMATRAVLCRKCRKRKRPVLNWAPKAFGSEATAADTVKF